MSTERLVFEGSVRALFETLPAGAQPGVAAAWKALGIDVGRLLPGYPVALWWRAVEHASAALEAGTREERLRRLGRGLTERFSLSAIGRATAPLARLMGPRRSLVRSGITFRTGNNYLETTIELDQPLHVRLRVNEVSAVAELFAGSIEALVTFSGGVNPVVTIEAGATETVFDVRWAAAS
jgi:uncharacterized protein (TIGR02265 family)